MLGTREEPDAPRPADPTSLAALLHLSMASSSRTNAELDQQAKWVSYKIRVTTGQLEAFVMKYQDKMPAELQNATEDALLEASLVNLRCLDDFFYRRRTARTGIRAFRYRLRRVKPYNDCLATDWLPHWQRTRLIDKAVRERIDKHIVHLSAVRRPESPDWQMARYALKLCNTAEQFLTEIKNRDAARFDAFDHDPLAELQRRKTAFVKHAS